MRLFLACLLVTLGAIELAVRLVLAPVLYDRAGDAYSTFRATERLLLGGREGIPEVVFGGDSLTRENVAPYPLAAALRLRRDRVLNLATSGGRPSDMRQMYRDYRHRLGRSRLLIYGVDPGQFNAAADSAADTRFKVRSGALDRLKFPVAEKVPDLLLGYFWRVWDFRPELHEQAIAALGRRRADHTPRLRLDELGRVDSEGEHKDPSEDADYAERHLEKHLLWQFELAALRDLVEMARADGVKMVLVEWPVRTTYTIAIEREYAAEHRAWKEAVRLASGEADFFEATFPSRWGLTDADFYDYGHLSKAGSQRFTAGLARWTASLLGERRPPR